MKNKITDLNNHLFAQLERLSDEDLKGEELKEEIGRAGAVTGIAKQIIASGSLVLKAAKLVSDGEIRTVPKLLGLDGEAGGND